jgi:signal transduction histidine kinase
MQELIRREDLDRLGRYFGHEVKNRLHVVELALERAAILSGDERVRAALEPARRAFRQLEGMVDDLRAAVGPSGQGFCGRGTPLRSVVEDLVDTYRAMAEERRIRLEADGPMPEVEVDSARLQLILANLLTNALRHFDHEKHERWIRIEARVDDGAADGGGAELRCTVRDNGVGISADRYPRLFEEARGGDGSGGRHGMGLAIVRQAVDRSGGRVWIDSEEGRGTAVSFTCRLSASCSPPARRDAAV